MRLPSAGQNSLDLATWQFLKATFPAEDQACAELKLMSEAGGLLYYTYNKEAEKDMNGLLQRRPQRAAW